MFKKSRNRILLLNMLMVSAVTLVAFATIFIITWQQVNQDNLGKLEYGTLHMSGFSIMHTFYGHTDERTRGFNAELALDPLYVSMYSVSTEMIWLPEPDRDWEVMRGSDLERDNERVGNFIRMTHRVSPEAGISFSLVVDEEGNLLEGSSPVNFPIEVYERAALEAFRSRSNRRVIAIGDRTWQFAIRPSINIGFIDGEGMVQINHDGVNIIRFVDVTDSHRMLRSLLLTLSALALVILTMFFFISRYFANKAIEPMKRAWEQQNRFVADASHELKTPLSVIQANCGALYANKEETVESQFKWIEHINSGADRMAGLINNMLNLTYIEDSKISVTKVSFDMSEVVTQAVGAVLAAATRKNINVESNIEPDLYIENDKERVRQVLDILIENAVKYTNPDGNIDVFLKSTKRYVEFTIRNTGEGIPDDGMPKVFERFYRADTSRESENGGYGLGLPIAKAVSELIGAKLEVSGKAGEYTEFSLILEKL